MLLPTIPFMLTLLFVAVAKAWSLLVKRRSMCGLRFKFMCADAQDVHRYLLSWIAKAVPFLNVMYNSLCMKSFDTFSCFQLRDQTYVLSVAPQIICGSDEHRSMIGVSAVAIVFYVFGIPVYVLATMLHGRHKDKFKDPVWLDVLGYMYQRYGTSRSNVIRLCASVVDESQRCLLWCMI